MSEIQPTKTENKPQEEEKILKDEVDFEEEEEVEIDLESDNNLEIEKEKIQNLKENESNIKTKTVNINQENKENKDDLQLEISETTTSEDEKQESGSENEEEKKERMIDVSFQNISIESQRNVIRFIQNILRIEDEQQQQQQTEEKEKQKKSGNLKIYKNFIIDQIGLQNESIPVYEKNISESLPLKRETRYRYIPRCFNCSSFEHEAKSCNQLKNQREFDKNFQEFLKYKNQSNDNRQTLSSKRYFNYTIEELEKGEINQTEIKESRYKTNNSSPYKITDDKVGFHYHGNGYQSKSSSNEVGRNDYQSDSSYYDRRNDYQSNSYYDVKRNDYQSNSYDTRRSDYQSSRYPDGRYKNYSNRDYRIDYRNDDEKKRKYQDYESDDDYYERKRKRE